jgi:hypothetical protein
MELHARAVGEGRRKSISSCGCTQLAAYLFSALKIATSTSVIWRGGRRVDRSTSASAR